MDPSRKARFDDLHGKLTVTLKAKGMSPKTADSYSRAVRQLAEHFDRCPDSLILVQYVLRVAADLTPPPEHPAWLCPKCGTPMTVFAFQPAGRYPIRIRGSP